MTSSDQEGAGRLDDSAEEQQPSSTTDGPAADGEYDASQGSPPGIHPTGAGSPEEVTRPDERELRRPTEGD